MSTPTGSKPAGANSTAGAAGGFASKLYVPKGSSRPGEIPDFSALKLVSETGTFQPPPDCEAGDTVPLARGLVRVLDDSGEASGPWLPDLSDEQLLQGLHHMVQLRAYDDRMFRMQRQGQLSFYIKSTGEEAVAVAQGMALERGDMLFPAYRQQGLLFVRGRDVVDMMCHCISNARDNCKGRQMPVFYTWKDGNFFSISGNLATQYSQAVGWAMASAYKGEDHIAASWVGEGSTAEADVHNAMLFAATYRAPVILNIVNNQWAISTPQAFAAAGTTFAARALGYNIPGIRVDGNDFLAVYAVTEWAARRARQGFGPTVIELLTYRVAGHSTSDNPDAYRAQGEGEAWPLGDPVTRLKQHLIGRGLWSEQQQQELEAEQKENITSAWKQALSHGSLEDGPHWPVATMFDDVFQHMPAHLLRQRQQLEDET